MKNRLFPIVSVLAVGLVGLVAGCTKEAAPPSFEQRMAAAEAVRDQREQNRLMAKLAKDAADTGDAAVVSQALGRISDQGLCDDVAEACALKLAKAGQHTEALQVANRIMSQPQRDSVVSKLAN